MKNCHIRIVNPERVIDGESFRDQLRVKMKQFMDGEYVKLTFVSLKLTV